MHGSPARLAELLRVPGTPSLAKCQHPRRTVLMIDMPAAVTACNIAMPLCLWLGRGFQTGHAVEGLRGIATVVMTAYQLIKCPQADLMQCI